MTAVGLQGMNVGIKGSSEEKSIVDISLRHEESVQTYDHTSLHILNIRQRRREGPTLKDGSADVNVIYHCGQKLGIRVLNLLHDGSN